MVASSIASISPAPKSGHRFVACSRVHVSGYRFRAKAKQAQHSGETLSVNNGGTVSIPGLWSLVFGNGDADKPLTTLFYTAGFADQTDGVFGTITPATMASGSSPY